MFVRLAKSFTKDVTSSINFKEPRFTKFFGKQSIRKHINYPKTSFYTFIAFLFIQHAFSIYFILANEQLDRTERIIYSVVKAVICIVLSCLWRLCLYYEKQIRSKKGSQIEILIVVIWTISSLYLDIILFAKYKGDAILADNRFGYMRTAYECFMRFYTMNVLFKYKMNKLIYLVGTAVTYGIMEFIIGDNSNGLYMIFVMSMTTFLCLFEDGVHKEEMHRYFCVRQESKKTRNILYNLSECVLILDTKGIVKFFNGFMRSVFLFDGRYGKELDEDFKQGFGELVYREHSPDYFMKMSISSVMLTAMNLRLKSLPSRKITLTKKPTLNGQVKDNLIELIKSIQSFSELVDFFVENADVWSPDEDYFFIFDTKFIPKDSNVNRSVEIRASILPDGENTNIVFLFRDTTERDRIATLENDNKLYRNNVLASFSHELRTPLNASLGFLEQSIGVAEIPRKAKDTYIQPALISNKLLLSLVNDILDFSQIIAGKFDIKEYTANITETVEHCVKLFASKVKEKGVKLQMTISENIPNPFYTDHQRISQILINLLSNAVKYTNTGTIQVLFEKTEEYVYRLTVKDTGSGMSQEDLLKLVSNLSTDELKSSKVNKSSSGIGLGLFISNALAKRITGKTEGLEIVSSPQKGTSVYLVLEHDEMLDFSRSSVIEVDEYAYHEDWSPIKVKDYTTDFDAREKKRGKSQHSKLLFSQRSIIGPSSEERILIVDDEIFNILVLENFCKEFKLSTERAFNGKDAIEKVKFLKKIGINVRVVLLDVNMPILDGYETSSMLKKMVQDQELSEIVIIGITAYVSPEMITKCYRWGFNEVLNKPISKEAIKNVLRNYGVSIA